MTSEKQQEEYGRRDEQEMLVDESCCLIVDEKGTTKNVDTPSILLRTDRCQLRVCTRGEGTL